MLQKKNKLYYSIGEVKEMTGIEPHVLRYWENEFPNLKPRKSHSGKRSYTHKDIDTIENIKLLLYGEKFTIKGAKNKIKEMSEDSSKKTKPIKVEKKQPKEIKKNNSQLVFGEIEKKIQNTLDDKEYLKSLKKRLKEISKKLKDSYELH